MHKRYSSGWSFGLAVVLGLAAGTGAVGAENPTPPSAKRAIELEDLFRLERVSDPQVSPDGKWVAYVVTAPLKEENRTNSDIWLASADGSGTPRQLTNSPKADSHPRWSPDGRWIAFSSTRSGESQIWLISPDGGEARKLTGLSTEASQPLWTPDGKGVAFVSEVFPEFSARPFAESERLNREKLDAAANSKVKAREFDHLLYRHWDHWVEGKRQHVYLVGVNPDGSAAGEPRDLTPGENDAVPTSDTFSAGDDFTFSPDGRELVTTLPPASIREQAWSTNYDVWSFNVQSGQRRNLTEGNPAADTYPRFSPDGRYLAYRAQRVPQFEADRWEIWLLDRQTGQRRSLTEKWDRSADAFEWSADGKVILVEAQDRASQPLFRIDVASGAIEPVVTGGVNASPSLARSGHWAAFLHHEFTRPPEVMGIDFGTAGAQPQAITRTNAARLSAIEFGPTESVTVPGAAWAKGASGPAPVQMWIVKPAEFDPARKYPLVFWVHGGPQGAFMNQWSTRWNPEVWAAQGYVVALPNPRGSTGFGQEFTNEISHDWGGRVYEDLLACLAYLKRQPYIDTDRMAAAGASFGGYMMNWFEGHVHDFKCLVTHDGVYNFDTMYATTDEVWFDEHEHGKPWENPEADRFSPHRYAAEWRTPMLVIHNDLDFRCPVSEGLAAFTVLQRKGIPSKLLMFPDEGHWVLKPQNSERWHQTIFAWLKQWIGPEAPAAPAPGRG
jgi:dipeptidyl aminopeptidase/acylaminoacyl peptidase